MAERHLTLEEAAKYLHVEPEELARMVKQREVPFVQNVKRTTFDTDALDMWASQRILQMSERHLGTYHRGSSLDTRYKAGDFALVTGLFAPAHMAIDLPSRTKASVIRDLVAIAEKAGLLYAPADLVRSLVEREAVCSTGIVGGVDDHGAGPAVLAREAPLGAGGDQLGPEFGVDGHFGFVGGPARLGDPDAFRRVVLAENAAQLIHFG